MDGAQSFRTDLFSVPKLSVPKLSVHKLSVHKMFSKSATQAPVPAKAPASKWSMPKMFSKSPSKQPVPAKAPAPVKAVSTNATPPEFSDLNGNPLSPDDPSIVPKMIIRSDYKQPVTLLEQMQAKSDKPDIMFRKMKLKYSLDPNRFTAVACDWLHKGQPVHT